MAVKISSLLNDQQFNSNGLLLSGGKIETFLAGSSTPATTFTTDAGNVAQSNPIILNTRGEVPNPIYLTTGVKYKLVLKDSVNNVLRTYDNVEGVNDSSSGIDQWVNTSVSPTFINATTFTLAGDQTNLFHVNRRVKLFVTAGTLYGFITASAFTTLTTVTVLLDSGVLDSGLSAVQLGLLSFTNSSLPKLASGIQGSLSGVSTYSATTTLTSSDIGKLTYITGTAAVTITLPPVAGLAVGATISLSNISNRIVTIAKNTASGIFAYGISNAASVTLNAGESIILATDGGAWLQVSATARHPTFSAFQSTAQSLATNIATKLQFQSEEFDTHASFDAVTNFRFQPFIAGYYYVSGGFRIATTTTSLSIHLYKNGAIFKELQTNPSNSGAGAYGSALVFLNGTTDFIELFGTQAAAAQNTTVGASSTYFQSSLLRSD